MTLLWSSVSWHGRNLVLFGDGNVTIVNIFLKLQLYGAISKSQNMIVEKKRWSTYYTDLCCGPHQYVYHQLHINHSIRIWSNKCQCTILPRTSYYSLSVISRPSVVCLKLIVVPCKLHSLWTLKSRGTRILCKIHVLP